MLIVNDDQSIRAGVVSLDECRPYCGSAFADYPLIMSEDASQTVYHVACALELATDLLVDLYTFFCPPLPPIHGHRRTRSTHLMLVVWGPRGTMVNRLRRAP